MLVAANGGRGDAQEVRDVLAAESSEIAQFDDLILSRTGAREACQRFVEEEKIVHAMGALVDRAVEFHLQTAPAALLRLGSAGMVHQDLPHDLCRQGVEMFAILEAGLVLPD